MRIATFSVLLLLFELCSASARQVFHLTDEADYMERLLQVSGANENPASFLLRPVAYDTYSYIPPAWSIRYISEDSTGISGPWKSSLNFFEPLYFNSYNSTLPRGMNDGAIWQGRGLNTALMAGFKGEAGPVILQIRPVFGFTQNQSFDLGPYLVGSRNEFAYRSPRFATDFVQRYGDSSFAWVDLGESSLELRKFGLRTGVSNRRLWTGPGQISSLQFGYNAPGFLHTFMGTYQPLKTGIGSFEFHYLFGGIRRSDYFTDSESSQRRNIRLRGIHSITAVYSPPGLTGLSLGATRSFIDLYPTSFEQYRAQFSSLFEAFSKDGNGDHEAGVLDNENQIATIFARWVVSSEGMEFYWEYGRNDHNVDLRDFRRQPDHIRAYILGMLKTVALPKNRLLSLGAEIMQGETPRNSLTRGGGVLAGWYTHGGQPVGFTHRGQILGSSFSPGSNYQFVWGDYFSKKGKIGIKLGRVVHHNGFLDRFFDRVEAVNKEYVERWMVRNIELMAGIDTLFFVNDRYEISLGIMQSFIMNHFYLKDNHIPNTRIEFTIRKNISGWLR